MKKPARFLSINDFMSLKIGTEHKIRFMLGIAIIIEEPYVTVRKNEEGLLIKQHEVRVRMNGGPWHHKELTLIRQQFRHPKSTAIEF